MQRVERLIVFVYTPIEKFDELGPTLMAKVAPLSEAVWGRENAVLQSSCQDRQPQTGPIGATTAGIIVYRKAS